MSSNSRLTIEVYETRHGPEIHRADYGNTSKQTILKNKSAMALQIQRRAVKSDSAAVVNHVLRETQGCAFFSLPDELILSVRFLKMRRFL